MCPVPRDSGSNPEEGDCRTGENWPWIRNYQVQFKSEVQQPVSLFSEAVGGWDPSQIPESFWLEFLLEE